MSEYETQPRPDVAAIDAVARGDIKGLQSVIESPMVSLHDIFATAIKHDKTEIVDWMMRDVMTTQIYPMGRLDAAVVATTIVKYGTQSHLARLAAIYHGHIRGLMRPDIVATAATRGLDIDNAN